MSSTSLSKTLPIEDTWSTLADGKKEQMIKVDSEMADCIWHKIVLHGLLLKQTQVQLSYFVSNKDTSDMNIVQPQWSQPAINQKHVLVDAPKGRNLWLKITISSNNAGKFPSFKNVKAYYSSVNYLEYLPAFYQEDDAGQGFLKRYLSIFEMMLQRVENEIIDVPELFDAKLTPSDFLPWLSTWVGSVKDENWPEPKWRKFLSQAALLYRYRGTKTELEDIIEIYTGEYPLAVVERALLKTGSSQLQELWEVLFGGKYSFCVLLWPGQAKTDVDQKVIKRIIDSEKPAHTVGGFVALENKIQLEWHTYLGVNTCLTAYKAEMYVGAAAVPINTVIAQPHELSL